MVTQGNLTACIIRRKLAFVIISKKLYTLYCKHYYYKYMYLSILPGVFCCRKKK